VDDLQEMTGHSKLKEEELDRTLRRIPFGRWISPKRDYSMMMMMMMMMMMNMQKSKHCPFTANRKSSGVLRTTAVRKRVLTGGHPDTGDLTK